MLKSLSIWNPVVKKKVKQDKLHCPKSASGERKISISTGVVSFQARVFCMIYTCMRGLVRCDVGSVRNAAIPVWFLNNKASILLHAGYFRRCLY